MSEREIAEDVQRGFDSHPPNARRVKTRLFTEKAAASEKLTRNFLTRPP